MMKYWPLSWEQLSALRTTHILSIGYAGLVFIPLVALVIYRVQIQFPDIELSLSYPLFFTYFASLLLSVAHFLNETMCPFEIKNYGSLEEYKRAIAELIKNESIIRGANANFEKSILMEELKSGRVAMSQEQRDNVAGAMQQVIDRIISQEEIPDHIIPISELSNRWDGFNVTLETTRKVILVLYAIAALIALLLSIRQIFIVFSATFLP